MEENSDMIRQVASRIPVSQISEELCGLALDKHVEEKSNNRHDFTTHPAIAKVLYIISISFFNLIHINSS